jgi:hypothetical protein
MTLPNTLSKGTKLFRKDGSLLATSVNEVDIHGPLMASDWVDDKGSAFEAGSPVGIEFGAALEQAIDKSMDYHEWNGEEWVHTSGNPNAPFRRVKKP